MKAMVIVRSEAGSTIEQTDLPEPTVGKGEVKIAVRAASVNRADLAALAGSYVAAAGATGPTIVGLDAAGVVTEAGPGAVLQVGQRVTTLTAGGLAETVVVDSRLPLPLPESWNYEEGAAAILALMTEHNALRTVARLAKGESVFVNGANSGVGQMGVRLARLLGAGRIIAGVRTHRDDEFLSGLGADDVLATREGDFSADLRALTGDVGVDIVVDHVGAPYLAAHIAVIAVRGRIVNVGRLGGGVAPELDLDRLALQRAELIGVTFRTRTVDDRAEIVRALRADLDDRLDSLLPRIDRVLPWTQVFSAQQVVGVDAHLGKVVLQVSQDA